MLASPPPWKFGRERRRYGGAPGRPGPTPYGYAPPPPPPPPPPAGWSAHADAATGRPYWYHAASGQYSWSPPSAQGVFPAPPEEKALAPPEEKPPDDDG